MTVKRLKYVAKVNPVRSGPPLAPDAPVSFFPMERIGFAEPLDASETRPADDVSTGYSYCGEGDILLAKITPTFQNGKVGRCKGLANGIGFATTEVHVLRPSPRIDADYLWFVVQNEDFRGGGIASMKGVAGQQRVPTEYVENYRCYLPSLPEQQALAAYLGRETARINTLIAAKRRQIELLGGRWRTQKGIVMAGLDRPGVIKTPWDFLPKIPAGWRVASLARVVETIQTGPFGSQLHQEDYVFGALPVINPQQITDGRIRPDHSKTVTLDKAQSLERCILNPGDIIVARRGELGRCAVVRPEEAGWVCGTGAMIVRPTPAKILSEYLSNWLSSDAITRWLQDSSVGSTMDNLNPDIMSRVPIPLPPAEDQNKILKKLNWEQNSIEKICKKLANSIILLTERRQALITHAVTGNLKIPIGATA